jgi:hypothetical protein
MVHHLEILFSMAQNWPEYIEYLSVKLGELASSLNAITSKGQS